ncbi:hypothetical protein Hanom_Chr06g00551321 [Helianthus anomalus]
MRRWWEVVSRWWNAVMRDGWSEDRGWWVMVGAVVNGGVGLTLDNAPQPPILWHLMAAGVRQNTQVVWGFLPEQPPPASTLVVGVQSFFDLISRCCTTCLV